METYATLEEVRMQEGIFYVSGIPERYREMTLVDILQHIVINDDAPSVVGKRESPLKKKDPREVQQYTLENITSKIDHSRLVLCALVDDDSFILDPHGHGDALDAYTKIRYCKLSTGQEHPFRVFDLAVWRSCC